VSGAVRVLVVEDHPVYRDGLAAALAGPDDLVLVAAVGTLAEARSVLQDRPVDVVLLDLGLPDGDGLAALPLGRAGDGTAAVVVLTMNDDPHTVLDALRGGASGYLLKGSGRAEVLDAVRRAADGGAVFSQGAARVVLDAAADSAAEPSRRMGLTPRETDILRLVGAGLSNAAIAARLGVSAKTVRNQVSTVLAKLAVRSRGEAAARARALGL
jgi:DNA-binding NarL/FixJ family response regulator